MEAVSGATLMWHAVDSRPAAREDEVRRSAGSTSGRDDVAHASGMIEPQAFKHGAGVSPANTDITFCGGIVYHRIALRTEPDEHHQVSIRPREGRARQFTGPETHAECKGNTALALPTWPYDTQDWIDRMFIGLRATPAVDRQRHADHAR